jgi:DNA-binding HxlR family transcriptional regulator
MNILYQLTDKGDALAAALVPMEKWAQDYIELENK